MRWLGGTPVVRDTPQGAVGDAAAMIAAEDKVLLGIAPAGTRTAGTAWRSGFYNIAQAAGVPIMPAAFDGGRRFFTLFPVFEPTGDYESDLAKLQALYAGIRGIREE
jgi:1-acyl-sn-glycerol-3-phosphate acyltransferase